MIGWIIIAALLIWAITHFYLKGEDLKVYDTPHPQPVSVRPRASEEHARVVASLGEMTGITNNTPRRQQLSKFRQYLDSMGADVTFDGEIIPARENGVAGEWLVPPGADTSRRLLYIHGGAFTMGSPLSHRAITTRYAEILGGAVFSLDYSLMPENRRWQGVEDCRRAYRWVLENAPQGKEAAREVFISGDSAGGNLTLALLPWIRDLGLQQPNAVVALSPATDGTLSSPSIEHNVATDHMLGPQLGKLNRFPRWTLLWATWAFTRKPPADPSVSPLHAELGRLPPTLVHASSSEMLLDDAVRWVNKARASGSPAELQVWQHLLHVWHIFVNDVPEAEEAFVEIEEFLQAHSIARPDEAAA